MEKEISGKPAIAEIMQECVKANLLKKRKSLWLSWIILKFLAQGSNEKKKKKYFKPKCSYSV